MKKILALDLGITSLGYAVVEEHGENSYSLIDNHTLMRNAPYDSQGNSTQSSFSSHKSARQLNKKQNKRVSDIAKIFEKYSILSYEDAMKHQKSNISNDKWKIRSKDVWDRKLTSFELFSILTHMAKHRGYKSISSEDLMFELERELGFISDEDIEKSSNDDEKRKVYKALNEIEKLKDNNPDLSISQIIDKAVKDGIFKAYRNHDNYEKMIRREDIKDEIEKIILIQKGFDFFLFDEEKINFFEDELLRVIVDQEDAEIDPNIFGKCAYLKEEIVAPRYSYLYDYYRLYKTLSDLKISNYDVTSEDREKIVEFVEDKIRAGKSIKQLNYDDIRKILSLQQDQKIYGKDDHIKLQKGKSAKRALVKFHFISSLSTFKDLISNIKSHKNNLELFKQIAEILQKTKSPKTIYKKVSTLLDESDIRFKEREKSIINLIKKKSSGSLSISHKFILKALPFFRDGLDEAQIKEQLKISTHEDYSKFPKSLKYLHLGKDNLFEKYENKINNHAIKSLASWSLNIVADLSYRYGLFDEIIVESTRDALPKKIKDAIEKSMRTREKELEDTQKSYKKEFPNLTKQQARKIKLWKAQDAQDLFSGEFIGIDKLFSGEADYEHILPQTLGGLWTDYNLLIALKDTNVTKNNRLPMDFLNEDIDYINRVEKLFEKGLINWKKRKNLLAKTVDEAYVEAKDSKGLRATSYLEALIAQNLKMFYPFSDSIRQKDGVAVRMIPGKTTSKARSLLGIKSKSRDTNFHHAEDALILATLSRGWQNRLHKMFRENYGKSEEELKELWKDITPHIEGLEIAPFIKESYERFSSFGENSLFFKDMGGSIKTISYWVNKKPLSASSHKDTIYSPKHDIPTLRKDILKEFSSLKIIEDRAKFTKEKFFEKYEKDLRRKLWVLKCENPKDETMIAIDKRASMIADIIDSYEQDSKKDKSIDEEYKQKLGELLKIPIIVSDDKIVRKVKFAYEKLSAFEIDRGLVETDKNFLGVVFEKSDDNKLNIYRVDVNNQHNFKDRKNILMAYLNELLYIFNEDKIVHYGCLRSYLERKDEAKMIALFNPRFPANPSAQPKNFSTKNDKSTGQIKQVGIGSATGVIKVRIDLNGEIKSYQKYGTISKELENIFLKESGYGSLEKCKDHKTVSSKDKKQ